MIAWKIKGTALYQQLPSEMHEQSEPVEELTELPTNRPIQESLFQIWEEIKRK